MNDELGAPSAKGRKAEQDEIVRELAALQRGVEPEQAQVTQLEDLLPHRPVDVQEVTAPFELLRMPGSHIRLETARTEIPVSLGRKIRLEAHRLGVSAAIMWHAAWAIVVARTSSRETAIYGADSTVARQSDNRVSHVLPVRLRLIGTTVTQLVEQTQRELAVLSMERNNRALQANRVDAVDSLEFTAVLSYQQKSDSSDAKAPMLASSTSDALSASMTYPIEMTVFDNGGEIFLIAAQTDGRIDPSRMIAYLQTALQSLLNAIAHAPETSALLVQIIPDCEAQQINSFNATRGDVPSGGVLHHLFEERVRRRPEMSAVQFNGQSLTYAQVNARANQLARYLKTRGVVADTVIGICVERGFDMVIALLGILKAGGAYMPLDPSYPPERLQQMLADARPRFVLTQRKLTGLVRCADAEITILDRKAPEWTAGSEHDFTSAESRLRPSNLLYVIYTSGSTGRPKGTAMPHGSMLNLIAWHDQALPLTAGTKVLQYAALSFDVAFQEIFSTLCGGGTLVLLDEWIRRDAPALVHLLNECRVQRLFLPPMMLQTLAEYAKTTGLVPAHLQDVVTAGEQLRVSPEVKRFFEQLAGCRLHNHYGPTETHVVTALTLAGLPERWPALPTIGKPILNTQIHILDPSRQPVPLGVVGEIFIGGQNVARGYLHRPELSAERFVLDLFSHQLSARMYRTGDLGRWRPDGTIEYLGRNDHQVKLRGFRIELGEIEAQLAAHERVKEVVVVAREETTGNKRLVAYITLRSASQAQIGDLGAYLRATLPDHMVPSTFVLLDKLPLTPSGKIDRLALPPPRIVHVNRQFEAPSGETEIALALLWQELLEVARLGRQDNFFELGGNSLHAMRLISRIERQFRISLPTAAVFKYPTVHKLAAIVEFVRWSRELAIQDQAGTSDDMEFERGVIAAGGGAGAALETR